MTKIRYPFSDQGMFNSVMENKELLREFLKRALPGIRIDDLELVIREAEKGGPAGRKKIRADLYAKDGTRAYAVELQMNIRRFPPRRGRAYHSNIDSSLLKEGEEYRELRDVYLIIISAQDPFHDDLAVYTFRTACRENGIELNDGRITMYINCSGKNLKEYPELVTFCEYIKNETVGEDSYIRKLDEEVGRYNEDDDWRIARMHWKDELKEERLEGFEEGIEEGKKEGKKEGIEEGKNEERKEGIYNTYLAAFELSGNDPEYAIDYVNRRYPSYSKAGIEEIINSHGK